MLEKFLKYKYFVQRDRWMAELDLEPHNKARVVVCSLHFRCVVLYQF